MVKSMSKSTKSHLFIESAQSTKVSTLSHCTRSTTFKEHLPRANQEIETTSCQEEQHEQIVYKEQLITLTKFENASAQDIFELKNLDESELVNEIPGGFEDVNELSAPCHDDHCSDYFEVEEIEQYVGLDWQDINVDSDSEKDFESPQPKLKCNDCGHHFTS